MKAWLAVSSLLGVFACDAGGSTTSAPQPGEERGPCRPDGTCRYGLTCASDLCVDLNPPADASGDDTEPDAAGDATAATDSTHSADAAADASVLAVLCVPGAYQGLGDADYAFFRVFPSFVTSPSGTPSRLSFSGTMLFDAISTDDFTADLVGFVDCTQDPPVLSGTISGLWGTTQVVGAITGVGNAPSGTPLFSGTWELTGNLADPRRGTWFAEPL